MSLQRSCTLLVGCFAVAASMIGTPATGLAAGPVPGAAHDEPHPIVMQDAAAQVASAPARTTAPVTPRSAQGSGTAPTQVETPNQASTPLTREVFGFALASSLNDPTVGDPTWNFSLLSTVAFFGLHISDDGTIAADSGWTVWNSSQLSDLLAMAHAHGTKVVVTVILQDFSSGTPHMCAGLTNRATTVTKVVGEVTAKGVDGVNLDYEGLNGTCPNGQTARSMMTDFAGKVRAALPAGSYLSVDTYASSAIDSLGFFDVGGLNAYVDSFFVMAYDLEYSNYARSPANCSSFCLGPTSPLTTYYYNDTSTAAQYIAAVPASKVILGVPYYGRKSCVSSAAPNQYPTGAVTADTYLNASTEWNDPAVQPGSYDAHRDGNDPSGQERWDSWYNTSLGCERELYWDDTTSLGNKYDLVNRDALRGVGIWNLNYGGGASELWSTLYNHFVTCTGAGVTVAPPSPQQQAAQVVFTATSSGCANPQYEFWLQYPSGSWVMKKAFSPSASWTWDTTSYPTGSYTVHVWANQQGDGTATYQALAELRYNLTSGACTTASLSPVNPSAPAGSTVALTASSAGCPKPGYEFWVGYPDGSWRMMQGFSPSTSFSWNTAGLAPGSYGVHVWANNAGDSAATWDANGFTPVTLTGCTSAALSPASVTQLAGTTVSLTASSSGCPNPLYEFWVGYPDGSWHMMQGFSANNTFNWNTAGMPMGAYSVHVWANQQGSSTATWEGNGAASVMLTSGFCTAASLSPVNPSSPAGSTVALTASSSGCVNPRYEFWAGYPDGSWHMAQGFSPSNSFSWSTAGLAPGNYSVHVWANNAGDSTATWEANGADSVTLTGCTSATLSPTSGSAAVGTKVSFTAGSSGCPNPQYEFWLEYPDGSWHMMQGFMVGNTWQWDTTGFAKGAYTIHAWANQQGAYTGAFEVFGSATYTLT